MMETLTPFELRIVRVSWASKHQPLDVETAWSPTVLIEDGRGGFTADITAYPEVSFRRLGQIGILAPDLASPPVLVLGDGESLQALFQVKAADGRIWWIEKGEWKRTKNGGYHDAPICRHAGEAHLRIGLVNLRLHIAMPGFNEHEFETLLDEFRNGLWQLILDSSSSVTASNRQADGGVSDAFLDAIRDYIRHAERALAQPHLELRERTEQQPLSRVRPMMRTFQELALRGAPRWITGRGHAPSYDTPENRLLLAMMFRLHRSLRALQQAAIDVASDFGRRADAAEAHAETLNGWVKVAPEKLEQEITELKCRADAFELARRKLLVSHDQDERLQKIEFKVKECNKKDAQQDLNSERFGEYGFCSILVSFAVNSQKDQDLRLVFDRKFKDLIECIFVERETYTVKGRFQKANNQDGQIVENVVKLCVIESKLENKIVDEINRLESEQQVLAKNGYWKELTTTGEMREQEKDRKADQLQVQRFRSEQVRWNEHSKILMPLLSQLSKLIERAKALKISIGQNLTVSGSMTYVQNPNYRGALAAFRRALDEANLDISKIDQLFRLDEIGILDMPKIYERWCLLKIVRVLCEHYNFKPIGAYQDDLFKALVERWGIKDPNEPIRIFFDGSHLNRDVLLEYEPIFPNNKRPDFVITVLAKNQSLQDLACHEKAQISSDLSGLTTKNDYPISQKKLVLDAKCKRFAPISSNQHGANLGSELEELITNRGYDENHSNRVFVLHPGFDTESAKEWQRFCRYGGGYFTTDPENRPSWDQGAPEHRHGAILLRPRSIDPLVRLITMHLYLSQENTRGYRKKAPHYQPFCPACGGDIDLNKASSPNASPWTAWCVNSQCNHMLVRNYCWRCGTHLWKFGGYWTFHEARALNPYDIKCPNCGSYL